MNHTNNLNHASIPTFNILENGKRKETLIHCFLERSSMDLDPENLPTSVMAKNGEVYTIIWDFPKPMIKMNIHVIISFQKHTFGNFAIVRATHDTMKHAELTFLSSYVGV